MKSLCNHYHIFQKCNKIQKWFFLNLNKAFGRGNTTHRTGQKNGQKVGQIGQKVGQI